MRTLIAAGASLLCSLAFQLSLSLYPTFLQPYSWLVKWLWAASIILWAIWGLGHPKIRAALWGDGPAAVTADSSATQWKTKEHWRLKYEAENTEKMELQKLHDERFDKCELEKRGALTKVKELEEQLPLFTPLQVEIIRLRDDLDSFVKECGNPPEPPIRSGPPSIKVGQFSPEQREWIGSVVDWAKQYSSWVHKMRYGYREKFAARLLSIINRIGAVTSASVQDFEPFFTELRPGEPLKTLVGLLENMTWQLAPVPIVPIEAKIRKLLNATSADEFLAVSKDEKFSEVLDGIPPSQLQ